MKKQEREEVTKLNAKFVSLFENSELKTFLRDLIKYFRFVDDTPILKAGSRKVLTDQPSLTLSSVSKFYKALQKAWESNYDPAEEVFADVHKPLLGGATKYGFPTSFADLQFARSGMRIFHNQLLSALKEETNKIYYENFDPERGVLVIGGMQVSLEKKEGIGNNQVRLLTTLAKEPSKTWYTDELVEDWGLEFENQPRNRFYDAAYKLNSTLEKELGIKGFIDASTKQIRINPLYLKET